MTTPSRIKTGPAGAVAFDNTPNGTPATDETAVLFVRMPRWLRDEIHQAAQLRGISDSELARRLLAEATDDD